MADFSFRFGDALLRFPRVSLHFVIVHASMGNKKKTTNDDSNNLCVPCTSTCKNDREQYADDVHWVTPDLYIKDLR